MSTPQAPADASPTPSRRTGGCVLLALGGIALAAVSAASPAVGLLTAWTAGGLALWLAARRRVSDSSATPPPRGATPRSGVPADEALRTARAATDPSGVMCTYHQDREEVNEQ